MNLQSAYIDCVLKELRLRTDGRDSVFTQKDWDTVYFGGGTPSTLSTPILNRLMSGIYDTIDTSQVSEWTMECNPDDVTRELAAWLGASPINRVSMGAQTFSDRRLRWLHRRHSAHQVAEAVALLRGNGIQNISIDLMFGFPGETIEEWNDDISQALALAPEHISAYSLMYEEGTPLYRHLEQGRIEEIDEELSLLMFNTLVDRLTAAGYEHYEISNFARHTFRSQHNSSYWHQAAYLGLGAAAHSYGNKKRWWNVSDVKKYIESIGNGILPAESEDIDETTRYNDIVTTALRTREGISLSSITKEQQSYLLEQAEPHIKTKKMALSDGHIHLTRDGIYTSDDIMSDLIMV